MDDQLSKRLNTLEDRFDTLDKAVAVVKNDVQNHLPTAIADLKALIKSVDTDLKSSIRSLDSRLWWFLGIVPAVAAVAAAIVEALIK